MNNRVINPSHGMNKLKWSVALVLLVLGFVANYYFLAQPAALRVAAWIILLCVVAFITLQTTQGKRFWVFAREARTELQRVVWPTRKETVQTTIVVFVMVIVLAIILWGVDSVLLWLFGWFTGRGSS